MLALSSGTAQKIEQGENLQQIANTVQEEESLRKRKKNGNRCSVTLHYVTPRTVLAEEQTFNLL